MSLDRKIMLLLEDYKKDLSDLEKLLRSHDWYFEYSDDSKVWNNGKANRDKIFSLMNKLKSDGYEREAVTIWKKNLPNKSFVFTKPKTVTIPKYKFKVGTIRKKGSSNDFLNLQTGKWENVTKDNTKNHFVIGKKRIPMLAGIYKRPPNDLKVFINNFKLDPKGIEIIDSEKAL